MNKSRRIFFDIQWHTYNQMQSKNYNYIAGNALTKMVTLEKKLEFEVWMKISGKFVNNNCVVKSLGMPNLECIRLTKENLKKAEKKYSQPRKNKKLIYGESDVQLSKEISCECLEGKYYLKYNYKPIREYIQIIQSAWSYNKDENDWIERCWEPHEWQITYDHEVLHIVSMRKIAEYLYETHFKETGFNSFIECQKNGNNGFPQSPLAGKQRYEYLCRY